MLYEMEECEADKNWTHFYKIHKQVQKSSYQKMCTKSCFPNQIFFKKNHFCHIHIPPFQNASKFSLNLVPHTAFTGF